MKSKTNPSQKMSILAVLLLAFMPSLAVAQDAFQKFENDADVTSVIINKKMFQMAGSVDVKDKDAKKMQAQAKKIEGLWVYETQKDASAAELKATTESYIQSAQLEELMRVKDGGDNVKIMIKPGARENQIREVLVFAETAKENHTIVVLVKGDFNLDEFTSLLNDKDDKPVAGDVAKNVNDALSLMVFPNPSSDVFYINSDEKADIKIYDLSGKLIKSEPYTQSGISVSDLSPATYIVEINIGNKRQTERIIVK